MLYNNEHGYVDVWDFNLKDALRYIKHMYKRYPLVALDTEFPGDPYGGESSWEVSKKIKEAYLLFKRNVDDTNMISLGWFLKLLVHIESGKK